jgi:small subunit ribosomal protein S6
MTLPAPTYDLVLLLDPQAEESARAKIVADTRRTIEGQGELLRHDEWGERPLSYPIERRASAEYHLMQLHSGSPELLSGLDRTLQITDGVLRFRIIKLKPGVPEAPDMGSAAARRAEAEAGGAPETPAAAAPTPPPAVQTAAEETPAETAAEAPAAEETPAEAAADAPAAEETPAEVQAEAPAAEQASGASAPGTAEQAAEASPGE